MSLFVRRCSLVVALSILAACGEVELSCEPDGDVTPLCGVQMPEDLEVMPNGGGLLIGEYGNGGQLTWSDHLVPTWARSRIYTVGK